ncbi:MAG: glutamate 5-kinase [Rhodobiaceae bacterium]|nr:glutamate 5-kinase [Rhodobiaceae bacterium]
MRTRWREDGCATGLAGFRRVVIKIGSALLVDQKDGLREDWLNALADDVAMLTARRTGVLIVSSGAIALGRSVLGLKGKLKLEESQAAASVGQIALARAWSQALSRHGIVAGQVLVTPADTEERRRYLNARSTLSTLLKMGAVPVINENDTIATTEIRYGDNDRLAARVAAMASADCLVLLSDIDGLYTAPPASGREAHHIPLVRAITPEIEGMAGEAGSGLSRGGMITKIAAGRIALASGIAMAIASGRDINPLRRLDEGGRATWFQPTLDPTTARKRWIAGTLSPMGMLQVDEGAEAALKAGKSLLPVGVKKLHGAFSRGDAVIVQAMDGRELARGLVAFDSADAARILGCNSTGIADILGYGGRTEMIHRDDLVLATKFEGE